MAPEFEISPDMLLANAQVSEKAWLGAKTPQEKLAALKRVSRTYDTLAQMDPTYAGERDMYRGLVSSAEAQSVQDPEQFFSQGTEDVLGQENPGRAMDQSGEQKEGEDFSVEELQANIEDLDLTYLDAQEEHDNLQDFIEKWSGRPNDPKVRRMKNRRDYLIKEMQRIDRKIKEREDQIDGLEESHGLTETREHEDDVETSEAGRAADSIVGQFNRAFGVQERTIATRTTTPDNISDMEDEFMMFFKSLSEQNSVARGDTEAFQRVADKVEEFYSKVGRLDGESLGGKEIHLQKNIVDQYIVLAKKKLGL